MATVQRRDPATLSLAERWLADRLAKGVAPAVAAREFSQLYSGKTREDMRYAWTHLWARPNQLLPPGEDWRTLFIRAGRGFGKTRTGAEAIRKRVNDGTSRAVLLIAPTAADARDVMIEQPTSGLLAVHPAATRPKYQPSTRSLQWPNGAIGYVRSAEDPDSIRGLNTDLVWGDEPASWRYGKESWDNAQLGLRMPGTAPHSILTGTPRPLAWLKAIEAARGTVVRTGSTYENMGNLSDAFIDVLLDQYEGTRLGQQELHALYLEDVEGALWRQLVIDGGRIGAWDQDDPWGSLQRALTVDQRRQLGLGQYVPDPADRRPWEVWVAVDPPGETAECGIAVGTAPRNGRAGRDHAVILDDLSIAGPPEVWGPAVVDAVKRYKAVGCVVETNQGGDMTRSTIHAADPNVHVEKIRAQVSKADRAEPVSMLYPKGWVHHLGSLAKLETQMTTWVPDESKSPDRLDAMVHLVTKLLDPQPVGRATVSSPARAARRQ